MKYLIKTIYLFLIALCFLLPKTVVLGKEKNPKYSQENISNYFSGIVSLKQNYTDEGLKYLKRVESLEEVHTNFSIHYINSLILHS